MPHLSKAEIERRLLAGIAVQWTDAGGKSLDMFLGTARERRLFHFVLNSSVREATALPSAFTLGLQSAFDASDDPATTLPNQIATTQPAVWRLKEMETEGFGGINIWQGKPFRLNFDCSSMLLEGPNGSGKSSLTGALVWALSGERPRDHAPDSAHVPSPVFDSNDQAIGQWPPLATYPPSEKELNTPPKVRVSLTFTNEMGAEATVERIYSNGAMTYIADPQFKVPSVLIETGLLMPARLSGIRLDEGRGRLTDAVQKLTGLDDLIGIGTLIEGVTHKSREYLSFKKAELRDALREFDAAIKTARQEASVVSVAVPAFTPADTGDASSDMASLGKSLAEKSTELAAVISGDIGPTIDLTAPGGQNQVISAIGAAREDLGEGLLAVPFWKILADMGSAIKGGLRATLLAALKNAEEQIELATDLHKKAQLDSRFQLKALSARWHAEHSSGDVKNCPVCEHSLETNPGLRSALNELRSAGAAATRTFDDSLTKIQADLADAMPQAWRSYDQQIFSWDVKAKLRDAIASHLVHKDRYNKVLVRFGTIAKESLQKCPAGEPSATPLPTADQILQKVVTRIAVARRLLTIADWFESEEALWKSWWESLIEGTSGDLEGEADGLKQGHEGLAPHLKRLSNALEKSGPYRRSALAMREAWKKGKAAAGIQAEVDRRQATADTLSPLKQLKPLCESIARETIDELSSSISALLKQIHLTETLHFQKTKLDRKTGLAVQGSLVPGLRINATLVANTSWLRAILWAFIFALREKAVKQLSADAFPVMVFDDPQSTFDSQHRHRWAQYIAKLQTGPAPAQIILSTHDETFLTLIKVDGVSGREALLAAAGPELGHLGILEGAAIARDFERAKAANTAKAGRDFMSDARTYVEGILKLMLRGENIAADEAVLGGCREKIRILNQSKGGVAPWNRGEFQRLVAQLDKNLSEIKHMEMAHHTSGMHLGFAEASDVYAHLEKHLLPALETGFRLIRSHQLMHGGQKALHAAPQAKPLPQSSKAGVRTIPLKILGRAAALTNGQVADGRLDLDEFQSLNHKKIVLAQHVAFRLLAATLEPIARWGDLLLVLDTGEPTPRSLVVAIEGNRLLARRFEIAENSSDLAVLTAQSVNPHAIAAPLVVQRATLAMRSIVGVLYGSTSIGIAASDGSELGECDGDAEFASLSTKALGLVEVVGHSAEPFALDGQFLVVHAEIDGAEALKTMSGRPVIAGDTDDNRYFKRLRAESGDRVVLESLESSGDFGPVVLQRPGGEGNCLERVWPVAGVLFELPS